jgi:molybdate transport system substrate-binding protein
MEEKDGTMRRRTFLKTVAASTAATAIAPGMLHAANGKADSLRVWSCGGLAEAFIKVNENYEKKTGTKIAYTGAFAAALGKSLLGNAVTDVFAGRVLALSQKLREAGKMVYFRPLCFTEYVIITPLGNPAGVRSMEDLARPGLPVILAPGASPPGGDAVMAILKKSGLEEAIMTNLIMRESCVIKMMPKVINGTAQASIVEKRLTCLPEFQGRVEVYPIPEGLFPPGPLTFTIGVMKHAENRALADDYVDFVCSDDSQAIFRKQGFIPAVSEKGKDLVEKLGVKDV